MTQGNILGLHEVSFTITQRYPIVLDFYYNHSIMLEVGLATCRSSTDWNVQPLSHTWVTRPQGSAKFPTPFVIHMPDALLAVRA
jgi:hypothetical protein